MVHITILSPLLLTQSLYIILLIFTSKYFYLLDFIHFYCPRLFVVVYKDVVTFTGKIVGYAVSVRSI